ncbi:MAG: hypothetical protein J6T10_06640 [Methanobrevibacter sp.]|nr:hypothetical protein [Methanobrevibacter sp.]
MLIWYLNQRSNYKIAFDPVFTDDELDVIHDTIEKHTSFGEMPLFMYSRTKLPRELQMLFASKPLESRLKVKKVQHYSNDNGITDFEGIVYELWYKDDLIHTFIRMSDFIQSVRTNEDIKLSKKEAFIKKRKAEIEKDFEND